MKKILLSSFSVLVLASSQSFAQDGSSISADDFLQDKPAKASISAPNDVKPAIKTELSETQKSIVIAKAELEDKKTLENKIALAKEMHKIRPTREQVDAAVKRASLSFPKNEQQKFISLMGSMLNYNAIERISVDAMIETYTLEELTSMVEYYSKPEAKSASKKVNNWAKIVQPEVVNMIDKAMMRIRAGQ